jgi:hypothetical protein
MWWVYDLLVAGRSPEIRLLAPDADESFDDAEERWRNARRGDHWQVSSER